MEKKKPQTFIQMMKHITDDMLKEQKSVLVTLKEVEIFIEGWLKGRQNPDESKFFYTEFVDKYCCRQYGSSRGEKMWWSDLFLDWLDTRSAAWKSQQERNTEVKRFFASLWRGFVATTPEDQLPWEYSPEKHKSPFVRSIDDSGKYGED